MILVLLAILASGTFFGAALYISLVQHPAILECETSVGKKFFPKMYNRAAPVQVTLAVISFLAGLLQWYLSVNILWLVAALLMISVVPITLIIIKPINDMLLSDNHVLEHAETEKLLKQWGTKHVFRTVVSGISFFVYLLAGLNT